MKNQRFFVDRQIRVEAELLRHIPKKGPDINAILPNLPPKDCTMTGAWSGESAEHADRRGFSGTVGAEKTEHFARSSVKESLSTAIASIERVRHTIAVAEDTRPSP